MVPQVPMGGWAEATVGPLWARYPVSLHPFPYLVKSKGAFLWVGG